MTDTRRGFLDATVKAAALGAGATLGMAALPAAAQDDDTLVQSGPACGDVAGIGNRGRYGASNWSGPYASNTDLHPIRRHQEYTIAEIDGPAVITHIHVRHFDLPAQGSFTDDELATRARGLTLKVFFDGVSPESVRVPLGDFFADGCGGRAQHFSTPFLEKAPGSYSCFIPMPFARSAKVVLRNESSRDVGAYIFVEYEALPSWNGDLGYLHATWQRHEIQVRLTTTYELLRIEGAGHLFGSAWSLATDDPHFADFRFVFQGNDDIRVDEGVNVRPVPGARDASQGPFGHGLAVPFIGRHRGVNLIETGPPAFLSSYHMRPTNPIRFQKELVWRLNWTDGIVVRQDRELQSVVVQSSARGGGWVDFATTFYWYQQAIGFDHKPWRLVQERMRPILHPNP